MKVEQIIIEANQNKTKKRPKSHLRFNDKKWWLRDIGLHHHEGHRGSFQIFKDQDGNLYCTDSNKDTLYGYWREDDKFGVSFKKSRSFAPYSVNKKLVKVSKN